MPAGYDGEPEAGSYPKVAVAPVPMCPVVPARNMYTTTQHASLSSVYAAPSLPYGRGGQVKSSVDVLLSRREGLKDELARLDAAISDRRSSADPVLMVVPPDLGFTTAMARPGTALGFSSTSYELVRPGGGYSLRNARESTRPISVGSHRKIVGTRVNPGGSFKWSMAYKTTNQLTNDQVYKKLVE